MKKIRVEIINPCKADGDHHMPGDTPELSEKDARALIDSGSAKAIESTTAQTSAPTGDQLLAAIRDAAASLDTDDESLWTNGGKPKTGALEAVLGFSITAAQRDEALEAEQA